MAVAKNPKLTKNWCVTSWIDKGAQTLQHHWATHGPEGTDYIQYIAGQEEICPETGKHHYQWWFQCTRRRRFTAIAKILQSGIHSFRPCDGTEADNEKYCKKSQTGVANTLFSEGHFSVQGKPTTMALIVESLKEGDSFQQLYEDHAEYIIRGHHATAIQHAVPFLAPVPETEQFPLHTWPTTGGWAQATAWFEGNRKTTLLLSGPPGCGKTKWCESLKLNGKATLVAQTVDSLKQLAPKYSVLCLDDWDENLHEMGGARLTQLFDRQVDVYVKCRYEDALIPRSTAVIVCNNDDLAWTREQHPGVQRRTTLVHVEAWDMKAETTSSSDTEIEDFKEGDYSPHSRNQWAELALEGQSIEAYYDAIAQAELQTEGLPQATDEKAQEPDGLDDFVHIPLVRSNARVWRSMSATASHRKRKRQKIIDLSNG